MLYALYGIPRAKAKKLVEIEDGPESPLPISARTKVKANLALLVTRNGVK